MHTIHQGINLCMSKLAKIVHFNYSFSSPFMSLIPAIYPILEAGIVHSV
jgi:hypothetical protein